MAASQTSTGRLLVVDDEAGMCETLADILQDVGFEVDVAGSGQEAIDCVSRAAYDLVLMDVRMPGLDGVETLFRIRALSPRLPVVLMTAQADLQDVERVRTQAEAILYKPLDLGELLELIQGAMRRADGETGPSHRPDTMPAIEREEDLGALVRRVGHDLRNKLGVMTNSLYFLNMRLGGESGRIARHLTILRQQIAEINRTIVNLMDIAQPKLPLPQIVSVGRLLDEALNLSPTPPQVVIQWDGPELPAVSVDVAQIAHALANLLAWVYDALNNEGQLRLEAIARELAVELVFVPSRAVSFDVDSLDLGIAMRLISLNGGMLQVADRPQERSFRVILPTHRERVSDLSHDVLSQKA